MKSVFIATPMFGGQCYGAYAISLIDLVLELHKNGYSSSCNFIYNESLINRARNNLVMSFLDSDFSHLLFIDADISFNKDEVLRLLSYDLPVLAGMYPKKSIDFKKITEALKDGKTVEQAVHNAFEYVGAVAAGEDPQIIMRDPNTPLKKFVYAGTGFMLISREVFDKLIPKVERYMNHYGNIDGLTYNFFSISIDPNSKLLLSEDYHFCKLCNEADIPIYVASWMDLKHTGSYTFGTQ